MSQKTTNAAAINATVTQSPIAPPFPRFPIRSPATAGPVFHAQLNGDRRKPVPHVPLGEVPGVPWALNREIFSRRERPPQEGHFSSSAFSARRLYASKSRAHDSHRYS